jgi:uncharacterized membrane protein
MIARDNRIVDTVIVQLLMQNIAFFTSATILVIGGLVAVLGAREEAMAALADLPFAQAMSPLVWDAKILLLIVIFVYAFFTFTWSMRQFNYVAIMIGAAPPPAEADSAAARQLAERAARIATRAGDYYNKAMRGFYFGLAALAWFVSPFLLMAASAWVVAVVWRREFRSNALAILGPVGEPVAGPAGPARAG